MLNRSKNRRRQAKTGARSRWKLPTFAWRRAGLVIAILAALLGFTGISGAAADVSKFLFFLFVALFVIISLLAMFAGRKMF